MAAAFLPQQNPSNLETYSLLWLDSSPSSSQESIAAEQHLRTVINYLKIFKQSHECEEYIHSLAKTDRVILIVSGRLGQEIVPRIHECRQVTSIYVYCMNKKKNEQWVKPFKKVKRIITHLNKLVNIIRDDQIERQRNKINETILINPIYSNTSLDESFRHSYLLIDCILKTNSALTDKTELISLCQKHYEGNENELKILEEFQENYLPTKALWWYTRPSFIYRLLRKALEIQDIKLLLLFRFFIRDIERQLEKNKCTSTIRVCTGQIMSNEEIQILKNNAGGFILISSFLSAGSRQQIQSYFSQIDYSNDLQRVLFEIEADPRLENIKPFSNITTQSFYTNEEQILFMFGSMFRLINVRLDQNHLWIVRMVLCSENDHQLKSTLKRREDKNLLDYGQAFYKLGRFDDAEIYYHHILKSLPSDHEDILFYYEELGNLNQEKGDDDTSLDWFNKSLEIKIRIDHPDIGDSYNNIGEIYLKKNDFKKAFDAFNKAIGVYRKKLGDEHVKIATCFNNMGHVCKKDKSYSKALEFYQKAFVIRQKRFPQDHPQIADSYKNIGDTYQYLNNLDQALEYYNRALEIYTKSFSPQPFLVGIICKNIGGIYENKKQFQQARSYYENAAASFYSVLPATDPHTVQIQQDIQRVTAKLK